MRRPRKSAPKVRNGKVSKKNRWELSPHYSINEGHPEIVREKPGENGKHYLRISDVENFIGLLPDWAMLSKGLKAIVLCASEVGCYGWHSSGIVAICAWDEGLVTEWDTDFCEAHRDVLERLNITIAESDDGYQEIRWTINAIKSFQLMHILLHELGHHHDRMSTLSQANPARGEDYAETYANIRAEELWDSFYRVFPY